MLAHPIENNNNTNNSIYYQRNLIHIYLQFIDCDGRYNIPCPSTSENTCISEVFHNDGIFNCPPPHCNDEPLQRCTQHVFTKTNPDSKPNKSDIVLSAITSLIFTLVGVGSCFWICWKIKDCLVGEAVSTSPNPRTDPNDRSNSANTALNEGAVELNLTATGPSDRDQSAYYRPSAPPLDEKHDSPPSYDALYPERNSK